MQGHRKTNQEIADKVNSMSFDKLVEGHEVHKKAEDQFQKNRMPLYIIVGVAFIIGTINGIYIGSDVVFLMCLVSGGGTFAYLWFTRLSGSSLPKDPHDR
jgi:hypothetical protein